MSGGVYHLDARGVLTEMKESSFVVELDLQELVARHPNLLVGDQVDQDALEVVAEAAAAGVGAAHAGRQGLHRFARGAPQHDEVSQPEMR